MSDVKVLEKTVKTVRIFGSTSELIDKWRGDLTAGQFVAKAVESYIKHELDNGDDLVKIRQAVEEIRQAQNTNLGLLCEVLRQAGILNGNGELRFNKEG